MVHFTITWLLGIVNLAKNGYMFVNRYLRFPMHNTCSQPRYHSIAMLLGVPLVLTLTMGPFAFAEDPSLRSEEQVAEHAKAVWESGAIPAAIEILDQGIQDHPQALTLQKLRADILATSRGPREAVEAYETVLARTPTALDVRWAKWSVLTRSGQGEESIAELGRIAKVDVQNPLVHLRLAQELRKLDRLEESLESYKKAVELVPDLLGWRLALARARFDVLDYQGADADVQYVLHKAAAWFSAGTPCQESALTNQWNLHRSRPALRSRSDQRHDRSTTQGMGLHSRRGMETLLYGTISGGRTDLSKAAGPQSQ